MSGRNDGIEARGSGTWRITVAVGRNPVSGGYSRIRETFHGTITQARARRDELRVDSGRGEAIDAKRESVADYLERWVVSRELRGAIRPTTARTYRGYVARQIVPRIGSLNVAEVRPRHVQLVLDESLAGGLSARSVVQVFAIMRGAFRSAVKLRAIAVDPSAGATPPKVKAPTLIVPTAQDVACLLAAAEPAYRGALAVSAGTGTRRGETLALKWANVDLESARPKLSVEGTLQRVAGDLVILPPKTPRSRRVVPLPPGLVATLRGVKLEQNERRLLAGPAWHDVDYVFDRGDGRPVDPDSFADAFRRARKIAGLDGVRLHDLRHAVASMLVSAGTNPRIVSDLLGHATVAFTLATYYHPDEDDAAAAVAEAERLIGPASS
jgi:integrase